MKSIKRSKQNAADKPKLRRISRRELGKAHAAKKTAARRLER